MAKKHRKLSLNPADHPTNPGPAPKPPKGKGSAELIISKSRTKGATKKCNVSADFYGALDAYVRDAIKAAEGRAVANKRKTLKPQDL